MSTEQTNNLIAAISVLLRLGALMGALVAGGYFHKGGTQNKVPDMLRGLVALALAFGCSGAGIALAGGR